MNALQNKTGFQVTKGRGKNTDEKKEKPEQSKTQKNMDHDTDNPLFFPSGWFKLSHCSPLWLCTSVKSPLQRFLIWDLMLVITRALGSSISCSCIKRTFPLK